MFGFFRRDWTDAEKWFMGIAAALIVAVVLALATWMSRSDDFEEHRSLALLLGYDGAIGLAKSLQGESVVQQGSQLDGYLKSLGIEDITYPVNPSGDSRDAAPAAEFAQRITGRLRSQDQRLESAFLLGWYGVITTNTPSLKRAEFDVRAYSQKAGYGPQRGNLDDVGIVKKLVGEARRSLR